VFSRVLGFKASATPSHEETYMRLKNLAAWTFTLALSAALASGCSKTQNAGNRSDSQVASDVQYKINGDANLPNKQITVNANNGVVSLSGSVGSDTERITAANDAAQVDGVKTVVNNLTVASAAATPPPVPTPEPATSAPTRSHSTSRSSRTTGNKVSTAPFGSSSSDRGSSSSTMANSDNSAPRPYVPPAPVKITVPAGTTLSVRMIDTVDTSKTQSGEQFSATLDSPVYVDDKVVIPSGADVKGRVVSSKSAGKFEGQSDLALDLINLSYGGHSYQIQTEKWEKSGAGRGKNTAAKVGGGAALGAIIGGLAGGGRGAAIGATAGAGAGAGAQAITHGQQVVVKPETLLTFTLSSPLTVMPSSNSESPNRRRLPVPDSSTNNDNQE
jgi:BON domain-containing protein